MAETMQHAELLVEGKNDKHVVWALCEHHNVEETFQVVSPNDGNGGVDALIAGIPIRLKQQGLRALGVVIDADESIGQRWQQVRNRLVGFGYDNCPELPEPHGTIIDTGDFPRVGIWIMPNNQLPGMLEDFLSYLIPDDDVLLPIADSILAEIEQQGLNRYPLTGHSKALIHTWLAWQETPGLPLGTSITAHSLKPDSALAVAFVHWLNLVFSFD